MDGGFFNLPVAKTAAEATTKAPATGGQNDNANGGGASMFGGLAVHTSSGQTNGATAVVDTSTTVLPQSIKTNNQTETSEDTTDLFMGLSMAPTNNTGGDLSGEPVADSSTATADTAPMAASGFSFLSGSTSTTVEADTPQPLAETSGFGFMSTPQQSPGIAATDDNSAISNFLTPANTEPSNTITPVVNSVPETKPKASTGRRSTARSGGPINPIIRKKNVRKKRSAKKRIGFDRAKAMEELNQSESEVPSSAPTSEPAKPKDNGEPADGNGSASSLLSGMTIHRSSAVDKAPDKEEKKDAPTTEKEAVATLPTFRGSVYTEEEEAAAKLDGASENDPKTSDANEENDVPQNEEAVTSTFAPPDLSSVMPPPSGSGSAMKVTNKDDSLLPSPDKLHIYSDESPAAPSTAVTTVPDEAEEEDDSPSLATFVQRMKSKFAKLETEQKDLEVERAGKIDVIASHRRMLNDVTLKQQSAIAKEDFEAAESCEAGINECKQNLDREEAALGKLLAEIRELALMKEKLTQEQVAEISSFAGSLEEMERVQKEKIEAHESVIESRKNNDAKRLEVLQQKLELEEEHVISDKKSLEEDRENLDAKIHAETSSFHDEKNSWETQCKDVQAEIDELTAALQKKQREMETIVAKIAENEAGIQNVMDKYLPRNNELSARKKNLEEKEESCEVQRLRIQEIKDSVNSNDESSNAEKEQLVHSLQTIQSSQKFVSIVSSTLKEIGTLRSSITDIVSEAAEHKNKIDVDIDLAKQSFSVAKAQEGEIEARVEEYRNKLAIIDERLPALNGEKKRAIQLKNFKVAGRVTSDIKKMTADREVVSKEMDSANMELNESVSLSKNLQDKVQAKEDELLEKTKEYDYQRLDIERKQRQLINRALRRIQRIQDKDGNASDGENPSQDLLSISLNASQEEISKLCNKYGIEDVVEEDEADEEEEVVQQTEVSTNVNQEDADEHESPDTIVAQSDNEEEKNTSKNDSTGEAAVESHEDEIQNEASQASETQNLEEQTQAEEVAGDDDKEEQIRLEKEKRIEELETLVEEAVGEDDFEKAETLQNEIDELKASL